MFTVIYSFRWFKAITGFAYYDVSRGQMVTCKLPDENLPISS